MNLETKITIYKFTPQVFTLTHNDMAKSMAYCHIFVQMINRYNVQTI